MANGGLGKLMTKVTASLRARRTADTGEAGGAGKAPGAGPGRRGRSSGSGAASEEPRSPQRGNGSDASAGAGSDGIVVSYAPERDGDADPGEVVWTWVPYEDDPTQGKDRPVLVVGWDGPQLAGVQLSSKDHAHRNDAREWVPVGSGAWDPQGRPSYVDASRLLRFPPSAVRREGAALDRGRFDEVLARVERLHDWHH